MSSDGDPLRLSDLRAELNALLRMQIEKGKLYRQRRAYLEEKHKDEAYEVQRQYLQKDVTLTDLSNSSKTAAALITSLGIAILAELAYRDAFVSGQRPSSGA